MGNGNIDVGNNTPTRKAGQPIVERLFGSSGLPELRIDQQNPSRALRPDICGAMAQQRDDSGNQSAPQELLRLVGCREKAPSHQPKAPAKRQRGLEQLFVIGGRRGHWMKSPHFSIAAPVPQGMIGTEDVEFFGEPSISLSE